MTLEEFTLYLSDNFHSDEIVVNKFLLFKELLAEKNKVMNLTGITEDEMVYEKHFYDSIFFATSSAAPLFAAAGNVLDLGSGAGFPGIPLALLFPKINFFLVEPLGKRCIFLQEVVAALELRNVKIINKRGEDLAELRQQIDIVTVRAVAKLPILLELVIPLLKVGGCFICLKGKHHETRLEIDDSLNAFSRLYSSIKIVEETVLPCLEERTIVICEKHKATDPLYPRNFSIIKRKPL